MSEAVKRYEWAMVEKPTGSYVAFHAGEDRFECEIVEADGGRYYILHSDYAALSSKLAESEAVSAGRLKVLEEKALEAKSEYIRAENAESKLAEAEKRVGAYKRVADAWQAREDGHCEGWRCNGPESCAQCGELEAALAAMPGEKDQAIRANLT